MIITCAMVVIPPMRFFRPTGSDVFVERETGVEVSGGTFREASHIEGWQTHEFGRSLVGAGRSWSVIARIVKLW